jgi:type IV pilus assembly protein PilW
MVALTLSALLVAGATQLFVDGQKAYRANERTAELQEVARHALALLELDLRMAGYWGVSHDSARIAGSAAPGEPLPSALTQAASGVDACGPNWAIHLSQHIDASDNQYSLACAAFNRRPQPDSDVLIVRRASAATNTPPTTPRLRIVANQGQGQLVIAPCSDSRNSACTRPPPLPALPGAQVHDLTVNAYYVSRDATGHNGLPSLRRKRLVGNASGAAIQDEEVIAGIENLQVQLGIGDASGAGPVRFDNPSDVDTDDALRPVVAVRLWLLVRAESPEPGFVDGKRREFPAGRVVAAPNDAFRRLLVTTTIYLRNTRS